MRRSARDVLLILVASVGLSVFGGVALFRRTEDLRRANPSGAATPGRAVKADVIAFRQEQEEKQEDDEGAYRASEAKADPSSVAVTPPHQEQQQGAAQQDGPGGAEVAALGTAVEANVVASRQEQNEKQEGGAGANPASEAKADPSSSAVTQGAARDTPHSDAGVCTYYAQHSIRVACEAEAGVSWCG